MQQAGEIKIVIEQTGEIKLAISPSLSGNAIAVLGLLDVARETVHQQQRQAAAQGQQRVQVATGGLVPRLLAAK